MIKLTFCLKILSFFYYQKTTKLEYKYNVIIYKNQFSALKRITHTPKASVSSTGFLLPSHPAD